MSGTLGHVHVHLCVLVCARRAYLPGELDHGIQPLAWLTRACLYSHLGIFTGKVRGLILPLISSEREAF